MRTVQMVSHAKIAKSMKAIFKNLKEKLDNI
jgi:hypothetical protein